MVMAPQKSKNKETKNKTKPTAKDPMKMVDEAAKLKEQNNVSFPPDTIELVVDQIATNQAQTARNMARLQLEESQQDLERIRAPQTPPTQPPSGGLFGQGQHPMIAMMEQLPKEDRFKFIEENKDSIFGAVGSAPENPNLAKLLHKDDDNGTKPSAATDMANMMVAFSKMQQDNMMMWMNLQKFQQPEPQSNGGGTTEKLMAMTLQQMKTIQESIAEQKTEMQTQMFELQQENMRMQREQNVAQMEASSAQHADEIQQLKKMMESREGQVTRGDLAALIEQANQVAGVNFTAETTADAQIRNDHLLAMERLKMEQAQLAQAHDEQIAAAQAKTQQWTAIGGLAAPFLDAMRLKKTAQSGGSAAARTIANRVSD